MLDDDALKGIVAAFSKADLTGELLAGGRQQIKVVVVTCEGTDQIGAVSFVDGLEGVGVCDVFFLEVVVVFGDMDIESTIGDEPPFVQGVFVGVAKADKFVVTCEVGKIEAGGPADRFDGGVACPQQAIAPCTHRFDGRRFVKATDLTLIGSISRPPTKVIRSLPSFFICRPRSTTAQGRFPPDRSRFGSPKSRVHGAYRCGGRGFRSIRHNKSSGEPRSGPLG